MRLGPNFTLEEFLVSQTAERHGIDMTPPPYIVENLQMLVTACMQPLRDAAGAAIFISSGYRPYELNRMIGGSETSAHMQGEACDFRIAGMTPYRACKLCENLGLPFDQLIHEFGRWVHLGVSDSLRGETLTAYRDQGQARWAMGIHRIEDLA